MCGILAVTGAIDIREVKAISSRIKHRGPDERDIHQFKNGSVLSHERLSIIDLTTGKQPIRGTDTAYVIHNGEIYNHMELRRTLLSHHHFRTTCDSEVIVHLYEQFGADFCSLMDGVFAFVVMDNGHFMAGRDPIGVKPLYYGTDVTGRMYFSSELKAISDHCIKVKAFPPGHYYTPEKGFVKFFMPEWEDPRKATEKADLKKLRDSLINATEKRLMSDVPLGVLLSGGLDSSVISAITARLIKGNRHSLHSFSVGINPNAPDMKAAREVAAFLKTTHHEVTFGIEEGIQALKKIIWHLETYDVTTIRAATPMYFLSKAITEKGIKVVLSGEGSDEIFGGYLYFHKAPSANEFQKELIRRISLLSTADCLRADKSTMAHGLEARVPFLDLDFLKVAMAIKPAEKQPDTVHGKPEKYILRKAFDNPEDPWLPTSILWRQKEQFGDGVGYNWIDGLIAYCEKKVSDAELAGAEKLFPTNTPDNKEAYYYRKLFTELYPEKHAAETVLKWIPKWQQNTDPSGRVCEVHFEKDVFVEKTVE